MQKHWLILYRGGLKDVWAVDHICTDERIAKMKLEIETIEHPKWEHAMVEIDLPAVPA